MRKLILASLALALLSPRIAAADEQADARAVLDRAVKAKGDERAMRKVVAFHATLESESYGLDIGFLSRFEVYRQGLDKARLVISSSVANSALPVDTQVTNGKEAWFKREGMKTKTMSEAEKEGWIGRSHPATKTTNGAEAASFPDDIYGLPSLVPFRKADYRLSSIGETVVAGRKVIGILVHHDEQDPVTLYFDKETYLLAKYERRFKGGMWNKEVHEETLLSDYRTVKGFKQPYKMEMYQDGRQCAKFACLTLEFLEKPFDDKLFAKP